MNSDRKPTMATLKSFLRKAAATGILHISYQSEFDGMVDCVMPVAKENTTFKNVSKQLDFSKKNTFGLGGWFVGGAGRNYISRYTDSDFVGYEVDNCCGSFILAIPRVYWPLSKKG